MCLTKKKKVHYYYDRSVVLVVFLSHSKSSYTVNIKNVYFSQCVCGALLCLECDIFSLFFFFLFSLYETHLASFRSSKAPCTVCVQTIRARFVGKSTKSQNARRKIRRWKQNENTRIPGEKPECEGKIPYRGPSGIPYTLITRRALLNRPNSGAFGGAKKGAGEPRLQRCRRRYHYRGFDAHARRVSRANVGHAGRGGHAGNVCFPYRKSFIVRSRDLHRLVGIRTRHTVRKGCQYTARELCFFISMLFFLVFFRRSFFVIKKKKKTIIHFFFLFFFASYDF